MSNAYLNIIFNGLSRHIRVCAGGITRSRDTEGSWVTGQRGHEFGGGHVSPSISWSRCVFGMNHAYLNSIFDGLFRNIYDCTRGETGSWDTEGSWVGVWGKKSKKSGPLYLFVELCLELLLFDICDVPWFVLQCIARLLSNGLVVVEIEGAKDPSDPSSKLGTPMLTFQPDLGLTWFFGRIRKSMCFT